MKNLHDIHTGCGCPEGGHYYTCSRSIMDGVLTLNDIKDFSINFETAAANLNYETRRLQTIFLTFNRTFVNGDILTFNYEETV